MKIGFTTMATPGMSVEEIVKEAVNYGFDGVDLRIRVDGEADEKVTVRRANEIRKIFGKTEISSLMCYNYTLLEGADKMKESILNLLNAARRLKVKNIRVFSGKLENDELLSHLADVINDIFKEYDDGINLLFQNHAGNGLTCEQALKLSEMVTDKRWGFIFSPDECFKGKENYMHLIPELVKITRQVYIADMTRDVKYCRIGEGVVPLKTVVKELCANGYDGYLSLKWEKIWCDYLEDYKVGFESFKKYLKV